MYRDKLSINYCDKNSHYRPSLYRNQLEALCKEKPHYQGRNGLTINTMRRITHGACSAIRMHSPTGDVNALRHDLRNGPHHCFGDYQNCNSSFCKCATESQQVSIHKVTLSKLTRQARSQKLQLGSSFDKIVAF